ncbi:MAG: site-specific recombinase XerC [Candidatus Azotimanducaceae bacterium]|jgi:site-specific recombinase XerC
MCASMTLVALPAEPETVAMFIADRTDAGRAVATLEHRLTAIRLMHLGQCLPSPHNTLAFRRSCGGCAKEGWVKNQKAPAVDALLKRMVDTLKLSTRRGLLDRALLLYGFAGALRLSELVGINVHHMEAHERRHLLTIRFSKGDQEGKGQVIPILAQTDSPYCPVAALQAWLKVAKIREGAAFRRCYRGDVISDKRLGDLAVAELIKKAIYQLHDESVRFEDYSRHSLRRGFLTSAGQEKADLLKLIAQSRHTRVDTVLSYMDDVEPFEHHAAERLLLSAACTTDPQMDEQQAAEVPVDA